MVFFPRNAVLRKGYFRNAVVLRKDRITLPSCNTVLSVDVPPPLWLLPELQRVCDTWDLVRTDLTGTMVACHVVP